MTFGGPRVNIFANSIRCCGCCRCCCCFCRLVVMMRSACMTTIDGDCCLGNEGKKCCRGRHRCWSIFVASIIPAHRAQSFNDDDDMHFKAQRHFPNSAESTNEHFVCLFLFWSGGRICGAHNNRNDTIHRLRRGISHNWMDRSEICVYKMDKYVCCEHFMAFLFEICQRVVKLFGIIISRERACVARSTTPTKWFFGSRNTWSLWFLRGVWDYNHKIYYIKSNTRLAFASDRATDQRHICMACIICDVYLHLYTVALCSRIEEATEWRYFFFLSFSLFF